MEKKIENFIRELDKLKSHKGEPEKLFKLEEKNRIEMRRDEVINCYD